MNREQDQRLSQLLIQGQLGDSKAYEHFLTEVSKLLRPFLAKRIGAPSDLEDVLQETLISIHRARHTYLADRPVGPWIYSICGSRIIDQARKNQRTLKINDAWGNESKQNRTAAVESNDQSAQVLELLKGLPPKQKQIIELLKLEELSVSQIASKIGMSESAVKVAAFRGYQTIRKYFGVKKE